MTEDQFKRAQAFIEHVIAGEMQTSGGGRFRSKHTNDETTRLIAESWASERAAERELCIAELLAMPGDGVGIITKYEAAATLRAK